MIERAVKKNCRDPGLNQGPSDLQSDALPSELVPHDCIRSSYIVNYLAILLTFSRITIFVIKRSKMCRDPGLNQGPSDHQSDALPPDISRRENQKGFLLVISSWLFYT